jgi:anti-sigma28 factor (negative regulator of flagellin synthesis)
MNQQETKIPPDVTNFDTAKPVRNHLSDLVQWVEKANAVTDIRMEKIEKVKEAIDRGDYQPIATDIADAIIKLEE